MRTAVITGASRGIGYAIALDFIKKQVVKAAAAAHAPRVQQMRGGGGWRVVLVGRDSNRLEEAGSALRALVATSFRSSSSTATTTTTTTPPTPDFIVCTAAADFSKPEQVRNLVNEIDSQYGPVSYLVNAAGISTDALLIKSSPDIIHHTITTNLTSTLLLTQGLIKGMMRISSSSSASKEDPLPSILNISSVTAVKGSPGQSIYSASKAGLLGFTRSLAAELVSRRIRVNAICPGYIDTDMTRSLPSTRTDHLLRNVIMNRMGRVDEVAHTAHFLFQSTYITGQTIVIDGGLTL